MITQSDKAFSTLDKVLIVNSIALGLGAPPPPLRGFLRRSKPELIESPLIIAQKSVLDLYADFHLQIHEVIANSLQKWLD